MAICTAGLVAFQDAVADGSIGARLTHLDRATAAQCASPKCRHHFAVVGGIGSWQRLLAFAPVSDMEACHDELICDGPSREAHATVWTRRRTDANGGSRITLWPRGAKRAKGGPKRAASREPVPRVGYDFTRYHLDVGARPCALYIDAAKLPDREGYVVVGTLACSGAAKPEDVVDVLAQVAVFPVGDKTQEVLAQLYGTLHGGSSSSSSIRLSSDTHSAPRSACLSSADPAVPVEASDPLAYHKLVEGADVKAWLRSVNNGRFDRPAYTRLADTMTWWELSTINLDDLELDGTDANAGGADPETDEELVIYARAFSHFCYYKLARSLRTHPQQLKRKDWTRISLHTKDELTRLGNVPEAVATHMLKQSFIGRGHGSW